MKTLIFTDKFNVFKVIFPSGNRLYLTHKNLLNILSLSEVRSKRSSA